MKSPFRHLFPVLFFLVLAAGGWGILLVSSPFPAERLGNWPTSPVLLDRTGKIFSVFLSESSEWSIPISLSAMGKWLPLIAVEVEDRRFWSHGGVDIAALFRALLQNARAGRVISGASTITSQLVRLSIPRSRTVATKAKEFVAAIRTEHTFSKDRILELYLNRAPFGSNIRGVEAAAQIYFSKSTAELSLAEAALLVGMLRGPSVYRPDRNSRAALSRRDSLLFSLADRKIITEEELRCALSERLPETRGSFPSKAWHFALAALGDRTEGGMVNTTLDSSLQALLEQSLKSSLGSLPEEITAAGAVMDNRTGDILAYTGNARLGAGGAGSWIDCARRLRSPGSILKPFAYLAAFERGTHTPSTLLADTPLAFSGQAPRNFDMTYRGPVSVRTALADSLNIPAVRVFRAAGPELVLDLLRNTGFRSLSRPTGHYGDSLILGGCEVTLLQAVEAYGMLANLGIRKSPLFLREQFFPERRIASKGAAFLVADILKDTGRLLPIHGKRIGNKREWFAFKTGTSYGYRDAWTAAYTPRFTAVVWMGDVSGKPHPELVGISAAAPAIVDVLRSLPGGEWYAPPPGVETRTVCALSGQPPSPACSSTRTEYALTGISSSAPCSLHVFRDGTVWVEWPPELEEFAFHRPLEVHTRREISIISPLPGSTYFLTPFGGEQKVALKAEGTKLPVYWFIGGKFAGKQGGRSPLFWTIAEGNHTVSLVDAEGRTAVSKVNVRSSGAGPEESSGPAPLLLTLED